MRRLFLILFPVLLMGLVYSCRQIMNTRHIKILPEGPGPEALPLDREFEEAYVLILNGDFDRAIIRLDALAGRPDRGGIYADDIQFWLAYCKQETGRFREAWETYQWLAATRPKSSYARVASAMLNNMSRRPVLRPDEGEAF